MDKKDLKSLDYDEFQAEMTDLGEKAFRARQMYQWFHEKLADTPDEMTNIPAKLKEKLKV